MAKAFEQDDFGFVPDAPTAVAEAPTTVAVPDDFGFIPETFGAPVPTTTETISPKADPDLLKQIEAIDFDAPPDIGPTRNIRFEIEPEAQQLVTAQAIEAIGRFGKGIANSFIRIGQQIASSPFSPIGISNKEAERFRGQAIKELESSGFKGGSSQAEQLIRNRSSQLAAQNRFPTTDIDPADGFLDKTIDVGAGLTSFVTQLAITRKILPAGTSEPLVWETHNQLSGGFPGKGVAIRVALGRIGKIPTGSPIGKGLKVGAESTLFAGVTAATGGNAEDIIVSALVPVAFNGWNFARQRQHLIQFEKDLRVTAVANHNSRISRGQSAQVSGLTLKADLRAVNIAVSKAKQAIFNDDAFAPAKEKWETKRQQALDLIRKGGKENKARGNAILDFIENLPPSAEGVTFPASGKQTTIAAEAGQRQAIAFGVNRAQQRQAETRLRRQLGGIQPSPSSVAPFAPSPVAFGPTQAPTPPLEAVTPTEPTITPEAAQAEPGAAAVAPAEGAVAGEEKAKSTTQRFVADVQGVKLSEATIVRETSIAEVRDILDRRTNDPQARVRFFALTPEMALGQGGNKGVLIEMGFGKGEFTGGLLSQSKRKPGDILVAGTESTELSGPITDKEIFDNIKRVTIRPDAKVRKPELLGFNKLIKSLERQGWTKTTQEDGTVILEPPAAQPKALETEVQVEDDRGQVTAFKADDFGFVEEKPTRPSDELDVTLHIGPISKGVRRRVAKSVGVSKEDVRPILDKQGRPTKKAVFTMTRENAETALNELEEGITTKLDKNQVRTEKDLVELNTDWADIKGLRQALGIKQRPRPFKVIRAPNRRRVLIDTTKPLTELLDKEEMVAFAETLGVDAEGTKAEIAARIDALKEAQLTAAQRAVAFSKAKVAVQAESKLLTLTEAISAAVQPSKLDAANLTSQQILRIAMKKAEIASSKAWLESAKDAVATRKDLNEFINSRIEQADLTPSEQKRLRAMVARVRTPSEKTRILASVNMLADRSERRKEKTAYKKLLTTLNKRFGKGKEKLGRLKESVRQPILQLIGEFDPAKLSTVKKKQLLARDKHIKEFAGNIAQTWRLLDAQEQLDKTGNTRKAEDILRMSRAHVEELDRLSASSELDSGQIRFVRQTIEKIIALNDIKWERKQAPKIAKLNTLKNKGRQEVLSKSQDKGINEEATGLIGGAGKLLNTGQMTLESLVGLITKKENSATTEAIVTQLEEFERDKARNLRTFVEAAQKRLEGIGWTPKDSKVFSQTTTVGLGGKVFKMDVGTLFMLYHTAQSDGGLRQLLNTDGLVMQSFARSPKTLFLVKTKRTVETKTPTLPEIRAVVKLIEARPKLKALSQAAFDLNWFDVRPIVNKAAMEYQNSELFGERRHAGLHRVFDKVIGQKRSEGSVNVENQRRAMPKTGGTARLRIYPFAQEFMGDLSWSANYAAGVERMADVRAFVNSHRWQQSMRESGRASELETIGTLIDRIQTHSNEMSILDLMASDTLNNFGRAALSLRISGYGIQTASVPASFSVIEPRHFHKAKALTSLTQIPIKSVTEMENLSPILWERWRARRFNYVTGNVAAQDALNTIVLGKSPILDKFLNQYLWGDQKAIFTIYSAAQSKVAADRNLKIGSNENKEAAIRLTEKALKTQPRWNMMHRSLVTSSPGVIARGFTMFSSARMAQYNVLLESAVNKKRGRISAGRMAANISGVAYANALVFLVKGLVSLAPALVLTGLIFLGDDEEKKKRAKTALFAQARAKIKTAPVDIPLNLIGLPAGIGSFFHATGTLAVRKLRSSYSKQELRNVRTGNIFTDLSLDAQDTVTSIGPMIRFMLPDETGKPPAFKSGPDKGKPKWKRERDKVATGIAELVTARYGLPLIAPRQEIVFRGRRFLKDIDAKPKTQQQPAFRSRGARPPAFKARR